MSVEKEKRIKKARVKKKLKRGTERNVTVNEIR